MAPSHTPLERDHVREEYSRIAEQYDTRWSFYVEATTRETRARLPVRPTDRVLDVGCGTGALLDKLVRVYPEARLFGVDPVPEMLAVARRRLPATIELREGRAEALPWDAEAFDVVVSCNMFHYIRQPVAALREFHRVLRPGGRLVITDWCDDYLACRVCDWYLRLVSPAHYKVYRQRECHDLLKAHKFSEATVERFRISWLWGLMTATAEKSATREAALLAERETPA